MHLLLVGLLIIQFFSLPLEAALLRDCTREDVRSLQNYNTIRNTYIILVTVRNLQEELRQGLRNLRGA